MTHSFDHLAAHAAHAARHANLESAADLRRRADRRRTRRRVAGVAAVAAAASVVVGAATFDGADRATELPPSSQDPTPPQPLARPTGSAQLDGTRQLVLLPVGTAEVVVVSGAGDRTAPGDRVRVADALTARADLVPTPVSPGARSFALKTGSLLVGGQPLCLTAGATGAVVQPCDFGDDDMIWRLRPVGTDRGFASYALVTDSGRRLDVGGDAFHLADTGPARIPTLD